MNADQNKKKTMLHISVFFFVVMAVCAVVLIIVVVFFKDSDTIIRKGFSHEMRRCFDEKYGIIIPSEASFVKGINLNGIRDSYVIVLFELQYEGMPDRDSITDYVCSSLNIDGTKAYPRPDEYSGIDCIDEYGGLMDYRLDLAMFTSLSYSLSGNKLLLRFVGWRPGREFE